MSMLRSRAVTRSLEDPRDLDLAGALLGRAFVDDPGFVYAFGDGDRRARVAWINRRFVDYTRLAGGTVTAIGDPPEGVLLWMDAPARYVVSTFTMLRAGMLTSPFRFGVGALVRLMRLGARLDASHARLMTEKHRYIYVLGVDPKNQGKGLGKALLRPKLEEADELGLRCYLETLRPENVKLYRGLGFEVAEDEPGPPGPRVWSMVRPTRAERG